jgi:hypothetical protein
MITLVVCIALGMAYLAIHCYLAQEVSESTAAFEKRFPPISDKEFLAQCEPGTNPEIALKVRRILSDSLGIEYERIHPNASLVRDLDAC